MSAVAPVDAAGYEHVAKLATPQSSLTVRGTVLKWYDIAPADAPVPLAIRALARWGLRDGSKTGALTIDGNLGFVILHRCGESFYFLLVSTWRNDNELWETVWAKDGEDAVLFRQWPIDSSHRPTFCVWELGAVDHERQAWSRYLRSARDDAARRAYLGDAYAGEV